MCIVYSYKEVMSSGDVQRFTLKFSYVNFKQYIFGFCSLTTT